MPGPRAVASRFRAAHRSRRASLAVVSAGVVVASALAPMPSAAAKGHFNAGTATAISQAVAIAPKTGGLSASLVIGTSIADYRGTLAQASSQAIDLGVVGTTLTVQCDAAPPALKPEQLPQPLIAESDKGTSHATKTTAGTGRSGALAVAGREIVRATTTPHGLARFDGNALVVPGLLTATGLHTSSDAHLIKGKTRIATASSQVGQLSLLGGVIKLGGMRWTASRSSGATHRLSAHFTMDSATLAGQKLPVASAAATGSTLDKINKTLKTTGLALQLPQRTFKNGKLSMSPLTIGISQSALGNKTINPLLTAIQPLTNQISNALIGINCKVGSALSLIDLALSAIDGTGALEVEFGGVSAANDTKSYGDAFGHQPPPPLGGHQPHGTGGHTTTTTGGGPTGIGGGSPPSGPADGGTTTGGGTATTSSSLSTSCATTSPAGRPSCSKGAGLIVGLGALGLLIVFAATDFFVLRRRRFGTAMPTGTTTVQNNGAA